MIKKIISLCPHLQRFGNEAPIDLEDVLYAIKEINRFYDYGCEVNVLVCGWQLKTDYRKQPKEVKELVKEILNN